MKAKVIEKFYQHGTDGFQVLAQIGDEFVVQWGLCEGETWEDIEDGYSYEVFNNYDDAKREFLARRELYETV